MTNRGWSHVSLVTNDLLLEYACATRDIHADDFERQSRFEVSLAGPSPFSVFRDE